MQRFGIWVVPLARGFAAWIISRAAALVQIPETSQNCFKMFTKMGRDRGACIRNDAKMCTVTAPQVQPQHTT